MPGRWMPLVFHPLSLIYSVFLALKRCTFSVPTMPLRNILPTRSS